MSDIRAIGYFSMEIGVQPELPTYAGGLGILAGDTVRSAADLQVPMVAVTLLHRKGYFFQRLDGAGWQQEEPVNWSAEDALTETGARVQVSIEGRTVAVRAWQFDVVGASGYRVPVYLLDTDVPENAEWDRQLTDCLYGGDDHYRLCQEVVLGFGGIRVLRALGHREIDRFHMNEGHAALLTLELLREERERSGRSNFSKEDLQSVHDRCVFTTHTPVAAGHDRFPLDLVERVLGSRESCGLSDAICHEGELNMTYLALSLSRYVNGVAKRHGEVARHMFADYRIDAITNGVHASTWVAPPMADLFDRYIAGWRQDNFSLRYALSLPVDELWNAHRTIKQRMVDLVNRETNAGLELETLTIGFARRATAYKRPDLIFEDVERLRSISRRAGRLQIVFAGKAHPRDSEGKRLIQHVIQAGRRLAPDLDVVFLPNYDMEAARMLTAGVDLWLNTPQPPLEASGTSGMKAALNGVPSLSVLDGWWIEGWMEGLTGWAIGDADSNHGPSRGSAVGDVGSIIVPLSDESGLKQPDNRSRDAASLYEKLEHQIIPLFYHSQRQYAEVMRYAIALNGSFFNTQRMLQQYVLKAYFE